MSSDYFRTPVDPEGFTVQLPKSSLRTIDFSALEYDTIVRAVIEYTKTYHPEKFNDFVASNGYMMLVELCAYVASVLSQRADILANESFLPTSFTKAAVENHLNLIGQTMVRQTPSTVQVMCTVDSPVATDIHIPGNGKTFFQLTGADGKPVVYEVYSAPYDWQSDIVIPARKYGVVAWGVEGQFAPVQEFMSAGGPNQQLILTHDNILSEPIFVEIDGEPWTRVSYLEGNQPNDKIFTVRFEEDRAYINFGDDKSGKAPLAGQSIRVRYRIGGGIRGRINVGQINQTRSFTPDYPVTSPVNVHFRNEVASEGGYDHETVEHAKLRAPQTAATHGFIASASDYAASSRFFRHPVYGSVLKAAATVHTSINANVVRIAVLAEGADGKPATSSKGLREALKTYLSEINVMTDDVDVVDGKIKAVDLDINIVVYNNVDASFVKSQVESVINNFFDVNNWDFGIPLYVSDLYEKLTAIDGISYVDIFNPADDILQRKNIEPDKIENDADYQEAKLCALSPDSPYNVQIHDLPNYQFTINIITPGVRIDDFVGWVQDHCDVYIRQADVTGSDVIYEFKTYKYMENHVVAWNELITLGNKNLRIYYEKK